jgi:hypothetical protein
MNKPTAVICVAVILVVACSKNQHSRQPDTPVEAAKKIEAALLNEAPYVAIKKYDPDVYNSALATLHEEARNGVSPEMLFSGMYARTIAFEMKRLRTAPNEPLVSFDKTVTAELSALNEKDADVCFAWLFPTHGSGVRLENYLPKSLIDENHAALAKAIQASIENPQPVPALSDVSSDLKLVQSELAKNYGEKAGVLNRINDPNVDKQAVCYMLGTLKSYMEDLPEDRAGPLLRYFYSKQS